MDNLNIDTDGALVMVYQAPDQTTAELVAATLQSAGIRAVTQYKYSGAAAGMMRSILNAPNRGVMVPASEADAARVVLEAQPPTEEELAAEAEADPMTLEDAEANVR